MPDMAASVLERLATIPEETGAALVMRHAEREEIPAGAFGIDAPLTAAGVTAAEKLGAALSAGRRIVAVSSPAPRCVQTAEAMLRGGGLSTGVATDSRLGVPGPFVVEPEIAGPMFLELPIPEIARRQLQDADALPGMRPTAEGVEILLRLTTGGLGGKGRLDVLRDARRHPGSPGGLPFPVAPGQDGMARLPGRAAPVALRRKTAFILAGSLPGFWSAIRKLGIWPAPADTAGHNLASAGPSPC